MGTRDYRWRETKKSKKGAKKEITVVPPEVAEVEVIKAKGKKPKEEGEEA